MNLVSVATIAMATVYGVQPVTSVTTVGPLFTRGAQLALCKWGETKEGKALFCNPSYPMRHFTACAFPPALLSCGINSVQYKLHKRPWRD